MIGDEDADSAILERGNNRLDVFNGNRINAGKRLIEQQEARPRRECPGNLCSTPLAARKRIPFGTADGLEPELADQLIDAVLSFCARGALECEHGVDVTPYRELRADGCLLRRTSEAATRPPAQ